MLIIGIKRNERNDKCIGIYPYIAVFKRYFCV
nr:MAG TPA: hypothetical protein [Caudoviricetes sp.]